MNRKVRRALAAGKRKIERRLADLTVRKGEEALFDDIRYFFYITNDRGLPAAEVVREACQRCNQENLIAQLKNGVRASSSDDSTRSEHAFRREAA